MDEREKSALSPYLAGGLSGLVLVGSVWIAGKYFGASTTFVRAAGMIEKLFAPGHVARNAYFIKEAPVVDWQWMFVLGIIVGSLIAALTTGSFRLRAVPDMWQGRFGSGQASRAGAAFLGGVVAMFGARLAGG